MNQGKKIIPLRRKLIGKKIVIHTWLCMTKDIIYIYIHWVRSARRMMIFTQNDWSQREIINKVIILTKQGTDTIHAVIPKKCQNYPSTTILKHVFFGGKVNKFSFVVIGKG